MTSTRRVITSLLAALALWPAAAAAHWTDYRFETSHCETTLIDAGRAEARWHLVEGVYRDEVDRREHHWVWTSRDWQARLLLAAGGPRTLRLVGLRGPQRLELRAFWNGVALGRREVGDGRATVAWEVPDGAARPGINRLRVLASASKKKAVRQLSFRLDRLELGPGAAACPVLWSAGAADRIELPPGTIALLRAPLAPAAEIELELEAPRGAEVGLYLARGTELQRAITLAAGSSPRTERLALADLLPDELVLIGRGPGTATVRLRGISGDEQGAAWRRACGLTWKAPLAGAALAGLLLLLAAGGSRWPGGRAAPWVDCGLLLIASLAVRFAFLDAYPEVDPSRFGDSWEYLRRSRHLVHGAPFWSDTSWHAWLSWIRPPGYYLMLAAVLGPLGGHLSGLAEIQAVLLAGTAVAGYLAAYPLFGRGAALAGGALLAVYPQTILSATWILSDPPSLFLTTAGLACLCWAAARRSWKPALAAGALLGIACLVRSAPLYFVPLAALLLYLGQPRPRRRAPAAALAAAALLIVLPWCVRNSLIYGKAMGIDDLMIPNFLMAHPDPEILPAELEETGVWGEGVAERQTYFRQLWRGNKDGWMTRSSGRILGRGLMRMAARPDITLRRFAFHLKIYFQPFPHSYAAHFLAEHDGCRAAHWTAALNVVYLLSLALAVPGLILAVRRREAWPLVAWVLYFVVVTNLFFYPSYMPGRYRLPIDPVLAVFAGAAVARAGELLARRPRRRQTSG